MSFETITLYGPSMLRGALVTIELVALSVSIGAIVAMPVALARLSPSRLLRNLGYAYVYFFRGTPLLAQLFLVYYGAGQFRAELEAVGLWWLFRGAFFCCIFTFSLNTAAYQAEIFRGAIAGVPAGQNEAGLALGMHRWQSFRKVIVPQAMILGLRPFGNEIILMIKSSAFAAIVTVFDLMGATRVAFARSFDLNVYLFAAVLYLIMVEVIRRVWVVLERRLTRHLVERPAESGAMIPSPGSPPA